MSGLLFAPARTGPHPAAIVIWLVFGGGVALVDLSLPVSNVIRSQDLGWIPASEYTWLAIAIMAANGLATVLSGRRQADPEQADPEADSAS